MPIVPVVQPDGEKIRKLLDERGFEGRGGATDFARTLRNPKRHPQTIRQMMRTDKPAGLGLMSQVAKALGVSIAEIIVIPRSDADEESDDTEQALAS